MIANIEVLTVEGGFRWQILGNCGRALVTPTRVHACSLAAFNAGKDWRTRFQAAATVRDAAR